MLGNFKADFYSKSANLAPGCDLTLNISPKPAEFA